MKPGPTTQLTRWRNEELFNIDFVHYSLSHHSFPRHFHNHYVIEWILEGTDQYYCNGKNHTAYGKQLVLINPGEVHTGSTVGDTALSYFSFYPDINTMQQVADALHMTIPPDLVFRNNTGKNSVLGSKMQALFTALSAGSDTLLQQELFFDCMQELLQQKTGRESAGFHHRDHRIKRLVEFIGVHFKDDISLQQMAGIVNLNPFHLVRLFKKNTGLSPYDYLLIVRTEHAKQLLRSGFRVQEAATTAGFYDSSHLNRSLRKTAATSPKSFHSSKGQYRTI